jgi:glycosyltransferase involved in cell wall biosynthesis
VIAEAMACGRAVIVSRAGGAAELVSHDVDALTHTPGNVGDLATRIAALAADGLLRARLGAAARARAEHQFDHSRLAREIVPVYESAVGSRLSALSAQPATGHR